MPSKNRAPLIFALHPCHSEVLTRRNTVAHRRKRASVQTPLALTRRFFDFIIMDKFPMINNRLEGGARSSDLSLNVRWAIGGENAVCGTVKEFEEAIFAGI